MKSEILSLLRESMLREKAADAPAGENQPSGMPAGKEQPTGREYISGQELCSRFGVSRTAVWKVINQLKEEGYEIEAVQNKGYRLKASPDVIGEIELGSRLQTRGEGHWAGNSLIFLSQHRLHEYRCEKGGRGRRAGRYAGGNGLPEHGKRPKGKGLEFTPGLQPLFHASSAAGLQPGSGLHAHPGNGSRRGGGSE